MKFLNNTLSLFLFLLINTVCVTHGNLQNCIDELLVEFRNRDPMDDFLIAFLNIKYISIGYSKETRDNEELYRGNFDLTIAARGYYLEMYYILQDLDLPILMSPRDYCRTEYSIEEDNCIGDIAAIGCNASVEGVDCLKHLYRYWKQIVQPGTLPGTEYLSDKRLLEAIYRGSDKFHNLSDEYLIEVLYRRAKTINKLSDENLLKGTGFVPREISVSFNLAEQSQTHDHIVSFEKYHDFLAYSFYKHNSAPDISGSSHYVFDEYMDFMTQSGSFDNPSTSRSSLTYHPCASDFQYFFNYTKYRNIYEYDSDMSGSEFNTYRDYLKYMDYIEYLKYYEQQSIDRDYEDDMREEMKNRHFMTIEERRRIKEERNRQIRENETLRQSYLRDARFERYGVADASFIDICNEYIRRKNTTRSFDYYYTMYIYDTLKGSSSGSVFKNCTDYCVTYVSERQ